MAEWGDEESPLSPRATHFPVRSLFSEGDDWFPSLTLDKRDERLPQHIQPQPVSRATGRQRFLLAP
jgi:hypothetical protein